MNILYLRKVLLYCTLINYALLLLWFFLLIEPHPWMYRFVPATVISPTDFDRLNFACMVLYKILVILFNLVPCIVLYLVRPASEQAKEH